MIKHGGQECSILTIQDKKCPPLHTVFCVLMADTYENTGAFLLINKDVQDLYTENITPKT